MRKTNQERWDELWEELETLKVVELSNIIGINPPTNVYTAWWNEIREEKIVGFTVRGKNELRFFNKKPTKKDIELLETYIPTFKDDEKNVFIRCKGNLYESSYNLQDIIIEKNKSFKRQDLIPIHQELYKKFAPREGYLGCKYCGKQTPINELISSEIIKRSWGGIMKEKRQYCTKQCASYDQMAQEG
jgi:hypothetical protein